MESSKTLPPKKKIATKTLNWVNKNYSKISTLIFLFSIFNHYAPSLFRHFITRIFNQFLNSLSPYIHLYIDEFSSDFSLARNDDFSSVQSYVTELGSPSGKNFRVITRGMKRMLHMNCEEEVIDRYGGVTVWWTYEVRKGNLRKTFDQRTFKLTLNRKHKDLISGEYLDYVISQGKIIREKNRTRRMCLNRNSSVYENPWMHVSFKHPASFDHMAMDPEKKAEIVADLLKFKESGEFYSRIGKAWKRGYLLYGPPGTGKSTMIAAMANLLGYDLYDLELTAVKDNAQLRKLLIYTSKKSIIAIEDIDCSLDVTAKRDKKKERISSIVNSFSTITGTPIEGKDQATKTSESFDDHVGSSVTLSGLLNFIDGLWSSLGGERIIVFTTNSIEKLDPALIRSGRMDKHIELSYCGFEGFKVLAKNYLLVEEHLKFDVIKSLLETTKMTPADVAENLMPKFPDDDPEVCLDNLIRALEKANVEAAKRSVQRRSNKKEGTTTTKTEEIPQANGNGDVVETK